MCMLFIVIWGVWWVIKIPAAGVAVGSVLHFLWGRYEKGGVSTHWERRLGCTGYPMFSDGGQER